MTNQDVPLGVRRLQNLVERVAPRDPELWEGRPALRRGTYVSQARARQLRATVKQLALAVGHAEMPEGAGRSVQRLLASRAVDVFLELAAEGAFRDPRHPDLLGKPLPWSTVATLRDCLKILGEEAGVEVVLPQVWRSKGNMPPSEAQAAAAYRRIADWAARKPEDAYTARTLAVVGVILDTGMQTAGMVSRTLADLDLVAGRLRCVYHPQNAGFEPVEATLRLRKGTRVALEQWLAFRERLVASLEGSDHGALWVTVTHAPFPGGEGGAPVYLAGMPLRERGFRVGHTRAMARLNAALAGRWDPSRRGPWVPLPTTPEGLRQAVDVEALVPALAEARGRFAEEERLPRWADGPHPGVPSFAVHGRDSTYNTYACRCRECYMEHSRVEAARRALRSG